MLIDIILGYKNKLGNYSRPVIIKQLLTRLFHLHNSCNIDYSISMGLIKPIEEAKLFTALLSREGIWRYVQQGKGRSSINVQRQHFYNHNHPVICSVVRYRLCG